jgi:hypothetical protein
MGDAERIHAIKIQRSYVFSVWIYRVLLSLYISQRKVKQFFWFPPHITANK